MSPLEQKSETYQPENEHWLRMGIRMKVEFAVVSSGYRQRDYAVDPHAYDSVLRFLHGILYQNGNAPLVVRTLKRFSGEEIYALHGLRRESFYEDLDDQSPEHLPLEDRFITLQDFRDVAYKNTLSRTDGRRILNEPQQPDLALSLASLLYSALPIDQGKKGTSDELAIAKLIKDGPFRFTRPILRQIASGFVSLAMGGRIKFGNDTTHSAHLALDDLANPSPPSQF